MTTDFDTNTRDIAEIASIIPSVNELQIKVREIEGSLAETSDKVNAVTNDMAEAKNEVSEVKQSLAETSDKVNAVENSVNAVSGMVDEYKTASDQKFKEIQNKNNELFDEIQRKIEKLQSECSTGVIGECSIGSIHAFAHTKVPKCWIWCDGQEISRKKYSELFKVIGTQFGKGDGSTTFNVPDLRGQFLRGYPGGMFDPDRILGSKQGDAIREISGKFGQVVDSAHVKKTPTIYESGKTTGAFMPDQTTPTTDYYRSFNFIPTSHYPGGKYPVRFEFKASNIVPTAHENRPVNTSVLFCIRASCDY